MKIPKKIHYCWFGRAEKSNLIKKCIASWKRYCPDYEIIEWNEENFDVSKYSYAQFCYENKKWAFLSDFVRLAVVCEHGGVYFDTDVELVKNLDDIVQYEAFYGFENENYVNTGQGFGSIPDHITGKKMMEKYLELQSDEEGNFVLEACPKLNTVALIECGLKLGGVRQNVLGAEILPMEYMNPYDDPTGRLNKTENTISIHWYSKSWLSKKKILRSKLTKPFHRIFGTDCFKKH